jgi:hypothetical protein
VFFRIGVWCGVSAFVASSGLVAGVTKCFANVKKASASEMVYGCTRGVKL